MNTQLETVMPQLGADPELILKRARNKVPAFGLIGGTKDLPLPMRGDLMVTPEVPSLPDGFFYQEDGAAFEFNIPPSTSAADFIANIKKAGNWIVPFLKARELVFSRANQIKLTTRQLEAPEAKNIGCLGDMCAYLPRDDRNRVPFNAADLGDQRYAGGHIHVQFNSGILKKHAFVRLADLAIMLAGVVMDKQGDRRKFYGRAGIYRDKPYGVELRGPSNMWAVELLTSVDRYGAAISAVNRRSYATGIIGSLFRLASWSNSPKQLDLLGDVYTTMPWNDVQNAINNEDAKLAVQLMDMIRARFPTHPFYLCNGRGDRF